MLRWVVELIENNLIEWLTRKEEQMKNSKEMEKWSLVDFPHFLPFQLHNHKS